MGRDRGGDNRRKTKGAGGRRGGRDRDNGRGHAKDHVRDHKKHAETRPRHEVIIDGRWILGDKIGSGSFGSVYWAEDRTTHQRVAVKVEGNEKDKYPRVLLEAKLYGRLSDQVGIPRCLWSGYAEGLGDAIVLELLGPSLIQRMRANEGRKLSIPTVLMLADQMALHEIGYVHRDIKPDNFLSGGDVNDMKIYLVDFGLSKRWRSAIDGSHLPKRKGKHLTGTARYASLNTHSGKEQSRRDDMQSIGHVLVYLAKGRLPWQGLGRPKTEKQASHGHGRGHGREHENGKKRDPNHKHARVFRKMKEVTIASLTEGLPYEFAIFMEYTRSMNYEEEPNYNYMRSLFRRRLMEMCPDGVTQYDWQKPPIPVHPVLAPSAACAPHRNGRLPERGHRGHRAKRDDRDAIVRGGRGDKSGRETRPEAREIVRSDKDPDDDVVSYVVDVVNPTTAAVGTQHRRRGGRDACHCGRDHAREGDGAERPPPPQTLAPAAATAAAPPIATRGKGDTRRAAPTRRRRGSDRGGNRRNENSARRRAHR